MVHGWLEDLPERLLTHYVGGAWRAPLGLQLCPVFDRNGHLLGQVVCTTAADLRRAQDVAVNHTNRDILAGLLRASATQLAHDLARLVSDAPDGAALQAMAERYVATGSFTPTLHQSAAILLPCAHNALLGLAIARLAQQAGLPAGAIALLHAPLPDQIKRDP